VRFADIWSARHLREDALLSLWSQGASHPHLEACGGCRERYASLGDWLERARTDLIDEADAAFPAERLAAQRTSIARRLEIASRPVRVLPFPAASRVTPAAHVVARRWVALAAAAGLLIGLVAGLAVDFHPFGTGFTTTRLVSQSQTDRLASEDAFLDEVEVALGAPHVEALRILDELTPRVREISVTPVR